MPPAQPCNCTTELYHDQAVYGTYAKECDNAASGSEVLASGPYGFEVLAPLFRPKILPTTLIFSAWPKDSSSSKRLDRIVDRLQRFGVDPKVADIVRYSPMSKNDMAKAMAMGGYVQEMIEPLETLLQTSTVTLSNGSTVNETLFMLLHESDALNCNLPDGLHQAFDSTRCDTAYTAYAMCARR